MTPCCMRKPLNRNTITSTNNNLLVLYILLNTRSKYYHIQGRILTLRRFFDSVQKQIEKNYRYRF
jgi:hypothetical protein